MTAPPRPALVAILVAVIGVAVALVAVGQRANLWERFVPRYLSSRDAVFDSRTPASMPVEPANRRRGHRRRANRRHRPAATAVASPRPPASLATPIADRRDDGDDADLQWAAALAVSLVVCPAARRSAADRSPWRTRQPAGCAARRRGELRAADPEVVPAALGRRD